MPYRQYTHCVQAADYNDPSPHGDAGQSFWSALTGGGFDQARAIVCDYLLGGKLVCLGGDVCAIGHLTAFEAPGDKPFPDNIDNDFSMSLLLMPHDLGEFANDTYLNNYNAVANDGHQGSIVTEQTGMPMPKTPLDNSAVLGPQPSQTYQGYYTQYPSSSYISYNPNDSPFQVPGSDQPFIVPVLHLECEGSRTADVCAALDATWGPIHNTVCQIPIIGGFLCTVVSIVLAPILGPIILLAVTAAWAAATDGNASDALVGGGTLTYGDVIVVTGRWVYDAAHEGWNEIHPVKTIQKLTGSAADYGGDFDGFRSRWCTAIGAIPTFDGPGVRPVGMTPAQTTTYDNQLQPENQWIFHPAIDGCTPAQPPPR
jgi:hypothetical protein